VTNNDVRNSLILPFRCFERLKEELVERRVKIREDKDRESDKERKTDRSAAIASEPNRDE